MQPLRHWPLVHHASLGFPFPRELAPYPTLTLFSWGNRQLILTFTGKISKESSGPFGCIQEENLLEQGHLFSSSACRPAFSLSTRCSLCRTLAVMQCNETSSTNFQYETGLLCLTDVPFSQIALLYQVGGGTGNGDDMGGGTTQRDPPSQHTPKSDHNTGLYVN